MDLAIPNVVVPGGASGPLYSGLNAGSNPGIAVATPIAGLTPGKRPGTAPAGARKRPTDFASLPLADAISTTIGWQTNTNVNYTRMLRRWTNMHENDLMKGQLSFILKNEKIQFGPQSGGGLDAVSSVMGNTTGAVFASMQQGPHGSYVLATLPMLNYQMARLQMNLINAGKNEDEIKASDVFHSHWAIDGVIRNAVFESVENMSQDRAVTITKAGRVQTFNLWGNDLVPGEELFLAIAKVELPKEDEHLKAVFSVVGQQSGTPSAEQLKAVFSKARSMGKTAEMWQLVPMTLDDFNFVGDTESHMENIALRAAYYNVNSRNPQQVVDPPKRDPFSERGFGAPPIGLALDNMQALNKEFKGLAFRGTPAHAAMKRTLDPGSGIVEALENLNPPLPIMPNVNTTRANVPLGNILQIADYVKVGRVSEVPRKSSRFIDTVFAPMSLQRLCSLPTVEIHVDVGLS